MAGNLQKSQSVDEDDDNPLGYTAQELLEMPCGGDELDADFEMVHDGMDDDEIEEIIAHGGYEHSDSDIEDTTSSQKE